jgi:hypothetical protein
MCIVQKNFLHLPPFHGVKLYGPPIKTIIYELRVEKMVQTSHNIAHLSQMLSYYVATNNQLLILKHVAETKPLKQNVVDLIVAHVKHFCRNLKYILTPREFN